MTEAEILARMGHAFSRDRMAAAFRAIQHPVNWKLGNIIWINEVDLDCTREAIDFFAGGGMTIAARHGDRVCIEFPGYYAQIGA